MPVPQLIFSQPEEFLDELRELGPNLEPVVRLTREYRMTRIAPIENLFVVATYLRQVNGHVLIVTLRTYVGQVVRTHEDPGTEKVHERARELMDRIGQAARAQGYTVRAGCYLQEESR
jgi:hypothetical protein